MPKKHTKKQKGFTPEAISSSGLPQHFFRVVLQIEATAHNAKIAEQARKKLMQLQPEGRCGVIKVESICMNNMLKLQQKP